MRTMATAESKAQEKGHWDSNWNYKWYSLMEIKNCE